MADQNRDPAPPPTVGPDAPAQAGDPRTSDARRTEEVNLARRRFFRQFAGELIQTAATVAGAAQALQRASAEAAGAILDPATIAFGAEAAVAEVAAPQPPGPPTGFRTPFREGDSVLYLID